MIYRLAADAVLLLHGAFIVFVLFGAIGALRWRWWPWVHLPAAAWGVWVSVAGVECPLTPLESRLRLAAGEQGYEGAFIEHYLLAVIYPEGLTRPIQWALGAVVLVLNLALYAWVWRRDTGSACMVRIGPTNLSRLSTDAGELMNHTHPTATASWPPRWLKWPVILLFVIGVGAFLWQALPGAGYSKDLSRVGAGQPVLVLAHDTNSVGSAEVMELMNGIRADYAGRVDFLVAHLALPEAQAFAARHGARQGSVLLFAADGRLVGTLEMPQSAEELRRGLALALVPEAAASAAPRQ